MKFQIYNKVHGNNSLLTGIKPRSNNIQPQSPFLLPMGGIFQ